MNEEPNVSGESPQLLDALSTSEPLAAKPSTSTPSSTKELALHWLIFAVMMVVVMFGGHLLLS